MYPNLISNASRNSLILFGALRSATCHFMGTEYATYFGESHHGQSLGKKRSRAKFAKVIVCTGKTSVLENNFPKKAKTILKD